MAGCEYVEAWRGACGDETAQDSDDRCPEHQGSTCRSCGDRATGGCSATHGLVCGEPLCDDCDCTWIG